LIPKAPEEPAETPVAVKKTVELFPVNEFKVSAIIWGSGKPQAIINDSVMSVGESIMDGKIVGIDKNGVHVSYEGEEVLLSIK
jgi:Tfp pilus assembly protein PilP